MLSPTTHVSIRKITEERAADAKARRWVEAPLATVAVPAEAAS
jgi:hypothetical protein